MIVDKRGDKCVQELMPALWTLQLVIYHVVDASLVMLRYVVLLWQKTSVFVEKSLCGCCSSAEGQIYVTLL